MPETVIAGRYRLENMLGRGGMSEVYCAHDLELGRKVALKLLAPDADTARFEREARAVASLGHPNVTQVYDYGEDEGRPFMVLEYVPGGTLEALLADAKGKPLPDGQATQIAAGIAAGLAHAHGRGVVHRDLKPANVLFDDDGRPKLADFGIARMAAGEGTLTEAGTVLGTAAYISPEQASGQPASAASDVYSFGVILYRMITGRLPFESTDPMELVLMNRDATPPPVVDLRPDAPGLLESATMAALEKDPANRPADGAALLTALGVTAGAALGTATTALAGADATQVLPAVAPGPAPTTVTPAAAAPPPRRRVPLLVAALLLLLLAGGALAYVATSGSSSTDRKTGTIPGLKLPRQSTKGTTTSPPSTTEHTTTEDEPTTSTTEPTTTEQATTGRTSTRVTTTQPTTTVPPPTTTPTTTPPTTTTVPPTTATTEPPPPTTTTASP